MNESEIKSKLEVIETYLKDQDQDINNMELILSKQYEELRDIKSSINEIKQIERTRFEVEGIALLIIIVIMIMKVFSRKHKNDTKRKEK